MYDSCFCVVYFNRAITIITHVITIKILILTTTASKVHLSSSLTQQSITNFVFSFGFHCKIKPTKPSTVNRNQNFNFSS